MSLVSIKFLLFFPVVVLLYWLLPLRLRNALLLVASVAFYLLHRPVYGVWLAWITIISYFAARNLESNRSRGKVAIWLGVLLLPLLYFKIKAPFIDSWCPELMQFDFPGLHWMLPIGLSCYTLQTVGYVIDVWRRTTPRIVSPLRHALFVTFLPTVTSGPIQRSKDMAWQMDSEGRPFDSTLFVQGMKSLVWGYFLKLAVADRFGVYCDSVINFSTQYNALTVFMSLMLYTIQIYTDFAGYSCIAIGAGNMLGFKMVDNFRRPLFSVGMKELWTRWHISFSSWLRDYVYIPLGGSRHGKTRAVVNTIATFIVSGMWHGVRPGYICWGIGHGIAVSAERFLPMKTIRNNVLLRSLMMFTTFITLSLLWSLFRDDWMQVCDIWRTMLFGSHDFIWIIVDAERTTGTLLMMLLGALIVVAKDTWDEFGQPRCTRWRKGRSIVSMLFYVTIVLLTIAIGVTDAGQFIYLRF